MLTHEKNNEFVLSGDGSFKIIWDIICMTLILYEIISIPF